MPVQAPTQASNPPVARRGAVILCGGGSRRMGRDKAGLSFGPELLLQRVVRLVSEAIALQRIVVVAARNQELPDLPKEVHTILDETENAGPLPALVAGLRSLAHVADVALAVGCDAPLIAPRAVRFLLERLEQAPPHTLAAIPSVEGRRHPLAAAYRVDAATHLAAAHAGGERSLRGAVSGLTTVAIEAAELRAVDPGLGLLTNCNAPEDYQAALAAAGFVGR